MMHQAAMFSFKMALESLGAKPIYNAVTCGKSIGRWKVASLTAEESAQVSDVSIDSPYYTSSSSFSINSTGRGSKKAQTVAEEVSLAAAEAV